MPNRKEPRIQTLGFSHKQISTISIEFSEEEIGKKFYARIGYILTNRAIKKVQAASGNHLLWADIYT